MSPVTVQVRDRLRLAGCLLAAGDWPEREQAQRPYKPHRLAQAARRALAAQRRHPAVAATQGLEPAELFRLALADRWPEPAAAAIADFAASQEVVSFCAESEADWQAAADDLAAVLARGDLAGFLAGLFGPLDHDLQVHPNLLYPGWQAVLVETDGQVVLSQPPPPAWGASPPWRYRERPDEVLGAVAEGLAQPLFARSQAMLSTGQTPATLALAAAVLFLRQTEGAAAADQFMLMEARARKLPRLPALVQALADGGMVNGAARPTSVGLGPVDTP